MLHFATPLFTTTKWESKVNYLNNTKGAAIARSLTEFFTLLILVGIIRYKKLTEETIDKFNFKETLKGIFGFFKSASLIGSVITLEQISYEIFVI